MKTISLVFIVVFSFIISCGNHSTETSSNKKEKASPAGKENTVTGARQDTAKWIDSFRAFRDAVYQRDKEKVKQYIDFPITNSRELWYLIFQGDEKKLDSSPDSVFTEKDYDKYFDALFPKRFINCLLKLKSEELWKTGDIQSPKLKAGNTTYIMYASVDKANNTLTLNLYSETPYKINAEESENAEHSEIYKFRILSNGKIKFIQVLIAG
jgi:hypothetical protein